MHSFRGALMRCWQWSQAECRRRRKLKECVVLVVLLQTVALLFVLAPSHLERNETVVVEGQKRIGQYIVLFTTTTTSLYPSNSHGRSQNVQGKPSDWEKDIANLDFRPTSISNNTHIKSNNTKTIIQKLGSTGGSERELDSDVFSNYPRDISNVIGFSSENDFRFESNATEEEFEDVDDPDVGRGFEEEYVTHRSNGNGVLLIGQYNSSIPVNRVNVNKTLEDHGLLNTADVSASNEHSNNSFNHKEKRKNENTPDQLNYIDLPLEPEMNVTSLNARKSNSKRAVSTVHFKFRNYNTSNPEEYVLKIDTKKYFTNLGGNRTCFIKGTNIEKTKQSKKGTCTCLKYYYGTDCGIPEAVWFSKYAKLYPMTNLKRRAVPRRVINGFPVNHEFAMFEARMHELYDVVDVFLIIESNFTSHGDPKEFQFLKRFQEGYLANFQEKMLYVKLGFFSNLSRTDGWLADSYIRYYMGIKGLHRIKGLKDDDLFVLSDADELPTRELMTFLKLYDGYPEPVGFGLRWNVFNFHWQMPADSTIMNWIAKAKDKLCVVYSAASIGFLTQVLLKNVFYIRKVDAWKHAKLSGALRRYQEKGHLVKNWVAGTVGHYAGWHCSWCFSPANIVRKMDSAQANDKPRWGDYPEKKDLKYITSMLKQGRWFDDQIQFVHVKETQERFYAPPHFMKHPEEYRSLLYHPNHPLNLNQTWIPP